MLVKMGIFPIPQIGVKIKNVWNHHPEMPWSTDSPVHLAFHQLPSPLRFHMDSRPIFSERERMGDVTMVKYGKVGISINQK